MNAEMIPWMTVDDEIYKRQTLAFGLEAQMATASTRTLQIGGGGVGSKLFVDLGLIGFGWLDLVEPDIIEESNLSRMMFRSEDVGKKKADMIVEFVKELRPRLVSKAWTTTIEQFPESRFRKYDLMIVATDNVTSRLYCNHMSLKHRIPSIQIGASLESYHELVSCRTVIPADPNYPCYECYNTFKPEEMRFGFVSKETEKKLRKQNYGLPTPVPSVVYLNTMAAGLAGSAAFKLVTGIDKVPPYVYFDVKKGAFSSYWEKRNPGCHACSIQSEASNNADSKRVDDAHGTNE